MLVRSATPRKRGPAPPLRPVARRGPGRRLRPTALRRPGACPTLSPPAAPVAPGADARHAGSLYGLRVADHISRRVFRVDTNHPVVPGLDDLDLLDWSGFSTLVPRDTNTMFSGSTHTPSYGWRWGTRHACAARPSKSRTMAAGGRCWNVNSTWPIRR